MFPTNSSHKRPRTQHGQSSDTSPDDFSRSSSKRIKVNQGNMNIKNNDENCNFMTNHQGFHQHQQLPFGQQQDHQPSSMMAQPPALEYSTSNGSIPSLAAATIRPQRIPDSGNGSSAYQYMNSYLGQLHMLRKLQRQEQHQSSGSVNNDTPRKSNKRSHRDDDDDETRQVQHEQQHRQKQQRRHIQQGFQQQEHHQQQTMSYAYLHTSVTSAAAAAQQQQQHFSLPPECTTTITPSTSWSNNNTLPKSGSSRPAANKKISLRGHSNLY